MSLRDVTEGHFCITIFDNQNFFKNKRRRYSHLPLINADYWIKWLIKKILCNPKPNCSYTCRHEGTSHGGTIDLSLEHAQSEDCLLAGHPFHGWPARLRGHKCSGLWKVWTVPSPPLPALPCPPPPLPCPALPSPPLPSPPLPCCRRCCTI